MRTTRTALKILGFKEDLLRHGIQREVFMCQLASNALNSTNCSYRSMLRESVFQQQVADIDEPIRT